MWHRISLGSSFFALLLLVVLAREVNQAIPVPVLENQDIYYSYLEGKRLRDGKNPYARILDGDMLQNDKYATYFPVFYELSYVSQALGQRSYYDWIAYWQAIFVSFEFGIGLLLFLALATRKLEWLGVLAAAFWLFNRWTLKVVEEYNLDFIPIFFMLLSLVLFPRRKWLSLVSFSLSLGFKQIAIFLAPLYLIWIWRSAPPRARWKELLLAGALIASVPLVSALPFLFWNAEGFVKSILFSATRFASNQFDIPSLDEIMGWQGISARLVMLLLMAGVYFAAFRGLGRKYFLAVLVLSIFLDYNAVLFSQYPAWLAPVVPLILLDFETPAPETTIPAATMLAVAPAAAPGDPVD